MDFFLRASVRLFLITKFVMLSSDASKMGDFCRLIAAGLFLILITKFVMLSFAASKMGDFFARRRGAPSFFRKKKQKLSAANHSIKVGALARSVQPE